MKELEDMQKSGPMAEIIKRLTDLETMMRASRANGDGVPKDFGTWTPVLTNFLNITGSTPYLSHYLRQGNQVGISGFVQIDPTIAGLIQLRLSIPIPSVFAAATDAGGTASEYEVTGHSGMITAVAGASLIYLSATVTDTANRYWGFSAIYTVLP